MFNQAADDVPMSRPLGVVVVGTSVAAQAAAERVTRAGARATLRCVLSASERVGVLTTSAALRAPRVASVNVADRSLQLTDGSTLSWDRLVVAPAPAPDAPVEGEVDLVSTIEEARAVTAIRRRPPWVVVLGDGIAAWEIAASVRARGTATTLIARSPQRLEAVLGRSLAARVYATHRAHGVTVMEGVSAARFDGRAVSLSDGTLIPAALVLDAREGRADLGFMADAGVVTEGALSVDDTMATAAAGVYAAGDVARWRDPRTGRATCLDHAAGRRRQGDVAADAALGGSDRLDALPYRRSRHFDLVLSILGTPWATDVEEHTGCLDDGLSTVTWREGERITAVVSAHRDTASVARSA
jgi:3-phenylpropionate/trans-cinnamate dioxygenase ferredoxin reductase subunit